MSANVDKNSADVDNEPLSKEESDKKSELILEGISSAKNSNGDTQIDSGLTETQGVLKEQTNENVGDAGKDVSDKNSKAIEEKDSNLTEIPKKSLTPDDDKGISDHTANDNVIQVNREKSLTPPEKEAEDGFKNIEESPVKNSQESNNKETDEDEMELKWDDDESMEPEGTSKGKPSPKTEDLLEEQLLADPLETTTEPDKHTETTEKTEHLDDSNKNPEPKSNLESSEVENEFLEDDINSKTLQAEEDAVIKECHDILNENNKVDEDTEMTVVDKPEEITKNDNESSEKSAGQIEEDKSVESQSTKQTEISACEITSFTDIVMDTEVDKIEEKLPKDEKDGDVPKEILEKETSESKEIDDNNDALLEDQLLAETDVGELIPDAETMDAVDDDKERELLKEDGVSQNGMDIKIEKDEEQIENKNEDQIDMKVVKDEDQTIDIKVEIEVIEDGSHKDITIKEETALVESNNKAITHDEVDGNEKDDLVGNTENSDRSTTQVQSDTELKKTSQTEETSNNKEQAENVDGTENLVTNIVQEEISEPVAENAGNKEDKTENPAMLTEENSEEPAEHENLDKDVNKIIKKESKSPEPEKKTIKQEFDQDRSAIAEDVSPNMSLCEAASSPAPIKTNHRLNRPDAMLEIPTQELLDIDDLSFGLDRLDGMDSLSDDDGEQDTIQDVRAPVAAAPAPVREESNVTETMDWRRHVPSESIEDSLEKMFADHAPIVMPVEETVYVSNTSCQTDIEPLPAFLTNPGNGPSTSTAAIATIANDTTATTTKDTTATTSNDAAAKTANDATDTATATDAADTETATDAADTETATDATDTATATAAPSSATVGNEMTPDTSNGVAEVSDSLGLLAESLGRAMEDDEEPEDDDDGDDDEDFDLDESSNQVSAEQSEDSNPPAFEHEPVKDEDCKNLDTPEFKDDMFSFSPSEPQNAEVKMEVDNDSCNFETLEIHAETIQEDDSNSGAHAVPALEDGPGTNGVKIEPQQVMSDQMDVETVKLSDTSDNEVEENTTEVRTQTTELKEAEDHQKKNDETPSKSPITKNESPKRSPSKSFTQSPTKLKKLEITTQQESNVVNIVDLEESSSSEDDIQEIDKQTEPQPKRLKQDDVQKASTSDVTDVNIPTDIEVMCTSAGNTSEIVTKEGEVVISGVPKPPPLKLARLNTSEVSIKTASTTEPMVIPVTQVIEEQVKPKIGLEIFSLDSDEDESSPKEETIQPSSEPPSEVDKPRQCVNDRCLSGPEVCFLPASPAVVAYYDAPRKKRHLVCQPCADVVLAMETKLVEGIKNFTPLLDLDMSKNSQDLVKISDSESEDEDQGPEEERESIGQKGAKFLEDNLAQYFNETWKKYNMDARLKETQTMLDDEINKLEKDSKEIDAMLNECQVATDKLRNELYATFECRRKELTPLVLFDMPDLKFVALEADEPSLTPKEQTEESESQTRLAKRRKSSSDELPAKKTAIALGYTPLGQPKDPKPTTSTSAPDIKMEDDKDISVVKLSAESAPADLPPPGEISRPPLRVNMSVYAMKNAFGPWLKGKIIEMLPKNTAGGNMFSLCRVKFDHKTKTGGKILPARCIAYSEPADVRMTIGTRLIALFKDSNKRESYYSGVVAEIPNPVNNYR
ncbi:dentin sialophosphoprotein-like [Spodoptera litura]|uniref:Dentin sialophosphoprotein-like n=1 Tax=Spodoptera litura TaxID=69820 RepID=A0A9J7ISH6_SPOLT|nr:dentin sialophosphoprotein-like [Spodoptera litura]